MDHRGTSGTNKKNHRSETGEYELEMEMDKQNKQQTNESHMFAQHE